MMTWNEYAEAAGKFDLTKEREQSVQFVHAYLGYCSELGELEDAVNLGNLGNIKEELGDQCWYIGILSRLTKHEPDLSAEGGISQADGANLAKRWFIGGKPPSESAINALADTMYKNTARVAMHFKIPMHEIYEANIAKLTARSAGATKTYAETLEESNRDRAAEAKIMEGK